MLSAVVPGLGFVYAGRLATCVVVAVAEGLIYSAGFAAKWPLLIACHVFQAVAAAGAVKEWNARHAAGLGVDVPPPPPPGSRVRIERTEAPPSRPPAPQPAILPPPADAMELAPPAPPKVLTGEAFLAELQAAWKAHRSGDLGAARFAERKWLAIRALRVEDEAEGEAVVAAASELIDAGIVTGEELAMLRSRVERR